jgi:hypothetical protein
MPPFGVVLVAVLAPLVLLAALVPLAGVVELVLAAGASTERSHRRGCHCLMPWNEGPAGGLNDPAPMNRPCAHQDLS